MIDDTPNNRRIDIQQRGDPEQADPVAVRTAPLSGL